MSALVVVQIVTRRALAENLLLRTCFQPLKIQSILNPTLRQRIFGVGLIGKEGGLSGGRKDHHLAWARPTFEELYEVPEKIVAADVSGAENRAAYDVKGGLS